MEKNPELSVVVLCYRSEYSIIPFIEKVKETVEKLTDNFEIILVANFIENSNDKTATIVQEIANKDTVYKPICKPKEGMMGWDMKEGLAICRGNYLCVIDGDGQFPIDNITKCYNEIKKGTYDLVKTYRIKREDGFYRKSISKIYNFLFSILFSSIDSKDINSKPKIFTRKAYNQMNLTSDDWFIDAEIMLEVKRLGISFYEFPTEFLSLNDRQSFVKFSAILEFVKNLFLFKFKDFKS
ncbi:glycosyltransferase family 2 protein [Polaribacter vadi]|uniref:glycosyltransferase family 2 protein n=1 Tax=Polaribacter vadi TaxID=1774273 RepID=UPI0030EBB331|tara:strand:- start:2667 stop:3383 length:717 start_codon:yes stop_codon:yes gene_type:complete